MKTELLRIKDKAALAFSITLKTSNKGDLLVDCDKGFAMCGLMDDRKMEGTNIVSIMLPAFDMTGILEVAVLYASPKAKELGITVGMKGEDALYLLMN